MKDQVIICPYCKKEIPLTEAISHQIREQLKKDFEEERQKAELVLKQKEAILQKRATELEEMERTLDEQVAQKIKTERENIEIRERQKALAENELRIKDLIEQVEEKDKKLQDAQKEELELRKQRRELEESKRSFELEMIRKIDEEREKIRETAIRVANEEHRFKDLEKEKQISDLRKQIEDLKRTAEQVSQQMQGEVLEIELADVLKTNFVSDTIEPVPKGSRGADILQKVHDQNGHYCGTIIWESKRTKAWSDSWIQKLKDDQREIKADMAVILSVALPKEVSNFAFIDGIWITNYTSMVGLVTALRINLIQVAMTKRFAVGKQEKMEVLYNYLSGFEFRQRVEAIVEAFVSMKKDLDQEKRAMIKIWSKREKQIERVITNTVGMYGDMQGIIGSSLPDIKSLEMETSSSEISIE